jgi:hypothetical protein
MIIEDDWAHGLVFPQVMRPGDTTAPQRSRPSDAANDSDGQRPAHTRLLHTGTVQNEKMMLSVQTKFRRTMHAVTMAITVGRLEWSPP